MEDRVTHPLDLETWSPPEAPVEMPYQVLERQRQRGRSWFALLRQLVASRARNE
jgi:hypothetical protein